MSHFEDNHIFPRTISTKTTENRQIEIFSKEEALKYFFEAAHQDCRISAFSKYEQEKVIPNLIFVDLDNKEFLNKALWLFHSTIHAKPTVLDTGNGYALLQPIQMKSWLGVKQRNKDALELSKLFLSWVERYLTNHNCDLGNHPSLKNTMIRIPGSYNSKKLKTHTIEESKVMIVNGWNKMRVDVKNLPFRKHVDQIIKKELRRTKFHKKTNPKNYTWIESILSNGITDGRARLLFDISRYLINIHGKTIEESAEIINQWLDSRYYSKNIILSECKRALKDGKFPRRLDTIKNTDIGLYEIILQKTV